MKLSDRIGEAISDTLFTAFCIYFTTIAIIIRPLWFIFDRRRYVIRTNYANKGWYRLYCYTHFTLREGGDCPNCGIPKQELVRHPHQKVI